MIEIEIHYDYLLSYNFSREICGYIYFENMAKFFSLRQDMESNKWIFLIRKNNGIGYNTPKQPEIYDLIKMFHWLSESIPRMVYSN